MFREAYMKVEKLKGTTRLCFTEGPHNRYKTRYNDPQYRAFFQQEKNTKKKKIEYSKYEKAANTFTEIRQPIVEIPGCSAGRWFHLSRSSIGKQNMF